MNEVLKLEPYLQMNDVSCASAALHVAYKALGVPRDEMEIKKDLGMRLNTTMSWAEMIQHSNVIMGFRTSFAIDASLAELSESVEMVDTVVIAGWTALDNDLHLFHLSPIISVNTHKVLYVETSTGVISSIATRKFLKKWYDVQYQRAYLAIHS